MGVLSWLIRPPQSSASLCRQTIPGFVMGKKKGKKGKVKDPQIVAKEFNEKMISAALTNKAERIVGNLAAREANPGIPTVVGVLEYKAAEGEGHQFIDVDYTNTHGRTPLMYASLKGFPQVVDCLLDAKAEPNSCCRAGNTAIHLAAHYGQGEEVLSKLVQAKAHIDKQDIDGETALHRAAYQGHESTVHQLLKLRAELAISNRDGR